MVTTCSVAAMEERIDNLERQMAEFRAEQGRFMEAMLKRMDELMVRQPRVEIDGDEGTSRIDKWRTYSRSSFAQERLQSKNRDSSV